MTLRRWPSVPFTEDEAGVIVHGPAVIARAAHALVAIRYASALRGGLFLAVTARAQLDSQQPSSTYKAALAALEQADDIGMGPDYVGDLRLLVTVGDTTGPASPPRAESSTTGSEIWIEASYWIDRLPTDQQLTLHASWPMMGVTETRSTLTLESLNNLDTRVLSLRVDGP